MTILALVLMLTQLLSSTAFHLGPTSTLRRSLSPYHEKPSHSEVSPSRLFVQSSDNVSFDISKPVFDLYAFRSVRGDALTKYNSLNQSEPLRINLAALALFTCLASPWLAEEFGDGALTLPQTAGAILLALASGAAFVRETQRRSNQLARLEKELEALDLTIRLPTNMLADSPFQSAATVRQLLRQESIRLLAVHGTADELKSSVEQLRVLGRRLVQANAYVVIIPTDNSSRADWGLTDKERYAWLANPEDMEKWKSYFGTVLKTQEGTAPSSTFRWFGLTSSGRSFGSGTTFPSWLQVMGKSLLPTAVLVETDPPVVDDDSREEAAILERQELFYSALTTGAEAKLSSGFDNKTATAVSDVMQQGGRLDAWQTCLADGARPEGMKIADADVTLVSGTLAFSTCIEFPALIPGASLLAVHTWVRASTADEWSLQQHQTIPWADSPAGGTLICDCRGCVSLVRSEERRTFGGLLG